MQGTWREHAKNTEWGGGNTCPEEACNRSALGRQSCVPNNATQAEPRHIA